MSDRVVTLVTTAVSDPNPDMSVYLEDVKVLFADVYTVPVLVPNSR